MTGKPAEVLGLQDRGLLKVGYAADIVMFDPTPLRIKERLLNQISIRKGLKS
jgi:N-acyl-D-amino-acid deacylase